MQKVWLYIVMLLFVGPAYADTPPTRAVDAHTNDGTGNGISSTTNGPKRGLDTHVTNAISSPVISSITDGSNTAAVKASTTPAATTDPALVVSISPNSAIEVTAVPPVNTHTAGTISAACASGVSCAVGSTVQVMTDGYSTVGYETHGTWSATLTTDISFDPACSATPNAVLWYNTASIDTDGSKSNYVLNWSEILNDDPWVMNVASAQCARIRAISYTSGTVNVTIDTGVNVASVWAVNVGNVASGATDTGNPIKVGGKYNSTPPTFTDGQRADLQLNANGALITRPLTSSDVVSSSQSGTWNVNNISGTISLPTGASTAANQTTGNASLSSIDGKLANDFGVSTGAVRSAAQIGNATGAAAFNAGTTSAQTLRVVLPTDQTAIPAAQSGTWNINNVSGTVSLPTGAATAANQTTANSSLSSIDGKLNSLGQKTSANSVPVTIASDQSAVNVGNISGTVTLPTGASTAANQATGNASLSSIDGKLANDFGASAGAVRSAAQIGNATGAAAFNAGTTSAQTLRVVLPTDQTAIPASQSGTWNINNVSGTVSLPTGAATAANQTTGNASLSSIDGKLNSLGQKTSANSVPVTISSDQSAVNVGNISGTVSLPTGASTAANQSTGNASLSSIDGKLANDFGVSTAALRSAAQIGNATGAAAFNAGTTSAQTLRVVLPTDQTAIPASQSGTWNVTNVSGTVSLPTGASTAANQTTGNSSLSSIDGKLNSLGQKTAANSAPVTIASDQSAVPSSQSGTWNVTNVSGTVSLPTGAATAANQTTANSSLSSIDGKLNSLGQKTSANSAPVTIASDQSAVPSSQSGTWNVTNVSGTVSLPTGASTAANQATGNASLSSIDGKIADDFGVSSGAVRSAAQIGNATGAAAFNAGTTSAQTLRVVLPTDQTSIPAAQSGTWNITNISGTVSLPTGAATSANQATASSSLSSIDGKLNSLGQKASANSAPVTIASDQSAIPASQSGTWNINNVSGTVSLPTGAATAANQATIITSVAKIPTLGQTTQALSAPFIQPGDLTSTVGSLTVQDTGSSVATQGSNQTVVTGTATAGSTFSVSTTGYSSGVANVTGTWTGSVQVETSSDSGTTWIPQPTHQEGGSIFFLAYTANVQAAFNLAGKTNVRVRAASAMTGTASVQFVLSYNANGIVFVNNAVRITDGANSSVSTPLTVLAASTAATTSNTSAVVALSPNTPLPGGNVASAAADSGNPVKVGGKYNSAPAALTAGNRSDLQVDKFGNTRVSVSGLSFLNFTAAQTANTIKSGAGILKTVCLNTKGANTDSLKLWDNTAASGTLIGTILLSGTMMPMQCAHYDLEFSTGLTITSTGTTSDWTVIWQ